MAQTHRNVNHNFLVSLFLTAGKVGDGVKTSMSVEFATEILDFFCVRDSGAGNGGLSRRRLKRTLAGGKPST